VVLLGAGAQTQPEQIGRARLPAPVFTDDMPQVLGDVGHGVGELPNRDGVIPAGFLAPVQIVGIQANLTARRLEANLSAVLVAGDRDAVLDQPLGHTVAGRHAQHVFGDDRRWRRRQPGLDLGMENRLLPALGVPFGLFLGCRAVGKADGDSASLQSGRAVGGNDRLVGRHQDQTTEAERAGLLLVLALKRDVVASGDGLQHVHGTAILAGFIDHRQPLSVELGRLEAVGFQSGQIGDGDVANPDQGGGEALKRALARSAPADQGQEELQLQTAHQGGEPRVQQLDGFGVLPIDRPL